MRGSRLTRRLPFFSSHGDAALCLGQESEERAGIAVLVEDRPAVVAAVQDVVDQATGTSTCDAGHRLTMLPPQRRTGEYSGCPLIPARAAMVLAAARQGVDANRVSFIDALRRLCSRGRSIWS